MGFPVNRPQDIPRYMVIGLESSTPRPYHSVDGSASAGSKGLLGSSDAATEMTRLDFDSSDSVKSVNIVVDIGQGAHKFGAMVVVNAGDDITAADCLNNGYPEVNYLEGEGDINSDVPITTIHVLALASVGATAISVKGRIHVRGRSYV